MGVSITIETRELQAALERTRHACRKLTAAQQQIGEHMVASIQKTFELQGRPEKWMPLSAMTQIRRIGGMRRAFTKKGAYRAAFRREEREGKILIQSRTLYRSITYKVYPDAIEIGSNLVYAARHQFGYKARPGRGHSMTPARPYLVVLPDDELEIARILEEHIAEPLQ